MFISFTVNFTVSDFIISFSFHLILFSLSILTKPWDKQGTASFPVSGIINENSAIPITQLSHILSETLLFLDYLCLFSLNSCFVSELLYTVTFYIQLCDLSWYSTLVSVVCLSESLSSTFYYYCPVCLQRECIAYVFI